MAVVCAAIAILFYGAAELRHREDHHIVHSRSEIHVERRDSVAELAQQVTELSLLIAFVHVRVPAADVCESDLQTHARFD